jgi:hypothetical protein
LTVSRLWVTSTNSIGWTGGDRRTVFVLGGHLGRESLPGLLAKVLAEASTGVPRVVLDVSALVACDRDTLIELARRRGRLEEHPGCVLDVVGARWSQFACALADEPVRNLDVIRALIRELRRPLMLDPYVPRSRDAAEGPTASDVPRPRQSAASGSEFLADLAGRETTTHDH